MWNYKHRNFFPPSFSNFPTHFFEFWLSPKSMRNRMNPESNRLLVFLFPPFIYPLFTLSLDFSSLSRFQISLRTLSSRAFFFLLNSDTQNHDSSIRGGQGDEGFEGWHRHVWLRGGCRLWYSDQMPLWGGGRIINEVSRDPKYQTDFDTLPGRKYFTCKNFEVNFGYFQVLCTDFDTFRFYA